MKLEINSGIFFTHAGYENLGLPNSIIFIAKRFRFHI